MSLQYEAPIGSGLAPHTLTVVRHRSLKGGAFITTLFPGGLQINDIWVTINPSYRRVSLPSRSYPKRDGSTGYAPILEFTTPDAHLQFEREVLAALDRFLGTGCVQANGTNN